MPAEGVGPATRHPVVVSVPEIRDYLQINRRLTQLLDAGVQSIRLVGVERQRLLVSGLNGSWSATIEVDGFAGPELGAGLDAPHLVVVANCANDGIGSGLKAGMLVLTGESGCCAGYSQEGGQIVLLGATGGRAGLEQRSGTLVLAGPSGPLCGERQRGGALVLLGPTDPHELGYARLGGRLESPEGRIRGTSPLSEATRTLFAELHTLSGVPPAVSLDLESRACGGHAA